MNVEAAADRLPWLADEPGPRPASRRRENLLPWAAALVAVVAAGGFWLGARSVHQSQTSAVEHVQPNINVQLPPAAAEAPASQLPNASQPVVRPVLTPEVRSPPTPEVRLSPTREVRIPFAPLPGSTVRQSSKPRRRAPAVSSVSLAGPSSAVHPRLQSVEPPLWNPRIVAGASGRLVQIGAFGSVRQAKRGWWFMVHDYPAMAHLPAIVRLTRNSRGRAFYRFDVGTTSQAHSEVLCQRMVKVSLSCAVVGLPWKAKVER